VFGLGRVLRLGVLGTGGGDLLAVVAGNGCRCIDRHARDAQHSEGARQEGTAPLAPFLARSGVGYWSPSATVTLTEAEGIPFATTTRVDSPSSRSAGISTEVVMTAFPVATPIDGTVFPVLSIVR
jgi:hypothetical protein